MPLLTFSKLTYYMKLRLIIKLTTQVILFFLVISTVNGQALNERNSFIDKSDFVTLSGRVTIQKNNVDIDSNIHQFNSPIIHILRTNSVISKGLILLLPGGGYESLKVKTEGENVARFLNTQQYDVAILEYHVGSVSETRTLTLTDAMKAFRFLKKNHKSLSFHGNRIGIMGLNSGGHLAACVIQKLGLNEQPDDLILISPSNLNETIPGTVYPAIMPPSRPTARLFSSSYTNDNSSWIKSCEEYTKIWKGYDGIASFHLLSDSINIDKNKLNMFYRKLQLDSLLEIFLYNKDEISIPLQNPATIPVEGYAKKRHAVKLAMISNEKYNLIMIGNSIINSFEKKEYQTIWNQFFAPRKALNLGYSGYRTENILWNIKNGELEGQSPKVVILEIGTNNIDEKNYPTRHTASQLAGGIESIVRLLREKLPNAKIIVLKCFPGCYGGPNPTSHRVILERASDIVSKLADGKHIFYCDVNHVFLNTDGSINHDMMSDWVHPSPVGTQAWVKVMEPLLSKLMGDKITDIKFQKD